MSDDVLFIGGPLDGQGRELDQLRFPISTRVDEPRPLNIWPEGKPPARDSFEVVWYELEEMRVGERSLWVARPSTDTMEDAMVTLWNSYLRPPGDAPCDRPSESPE